MFGRLLKRDDAAHYLGRSPRSFDAEVRPFVPYLLVGKTGKVWDRLDLDAWADRQRKILPAGCREHEGGEARPGERKSRRAGSGASPKASSGASFDRLLAAARAKAPAAGRS